MTIQFKVFAISSLFIAVAILSPLTAMLAQENLITKQIALAPKAAKDTEPIFHLLPLEEDQEAGNAVPVLLRMVYEQHQFMKDVYPILGDYAEMEVDDPKLHELQFNRFAEQFIRAGSMSFADWEYPLRSERPYLILLPDIQSQRQLAGRGMTAWIKQRLSQGETIEALQGIRAQIACGRHCAATPVAVCYGVGIAIANMGFDNLELAMQSEDCPNMYWALASLPPTLHELGPMVRWELWASPARLSEPLPQVGDDAWKFLADAFAERYTVELSEKYTWEEGEKLRKNIERLAREALPEAYGFSEAEMQQMSSEELGMRWIYMQYCRLRTKVEPLMYQDPRQVIVVKNEIDAENTALLAATGAKSSPLPVDIPPFVLACRTFERRVKFLQTIEALRDHAAKHGGEFPEKLEELELRAPTDPITGHPYIYYSGKKVRLRQATLEGFSTKIYDYELSTK